MNTPRTDKHKFRIGDSEHFAVHEIYSRELETELAVIRKALSQVADSLGNGSVVSADASVEFMTVDLPNEVRLYCSRLRSTLAAMTKERNEEREKVAKLREALDQINRVSVTN